jgi:hypothetical protein
VREHFAVAPIKDKPAYNKPHERPHEAAPIVGKCPIDAHDADPEEVGDEPRGVAGPIPPSLSFQGFPSLMPIDAAFGFAFFDVEITFEIVVFCLFRDFSKSAQAKWDVAVLNPSALAWGNKTNMGAGEIDLGGIGHTIEIWKTAKARVGKIGVPLE